MFKLNLKYIVTIIISIVIIINGCTYKKFNPSTPFDDKALLDSATNEAALTYYKNQNSVLSGSSGNSPHGSFKLKFNKTAFANLTDNGKLPVGKKFSDGSLVVKEIQGNDLIAFMYKNKGSWLWGEAYKNGEIIISVKDDPTAACVNCHSQSGNRDLVVAFNFY